MVVFWSIPARDDLKGIHDYIARDSKRYATRVTQDIRDKAKTLIEFPRLGKSVVEVGEENVREINLYSYRIMYEVMCYFPHSRRKISLISAKFSS